MSDSRMYPVGGGAVQSEYVSANLVFSEGQAGQQIHFGKDADGLDIKFFGATSGAYMLWDEAADFLAFNDAGIDPAGTPPGNAFIDVSDLSLGSGQRVIHGSGVDTDAVTGWIRLSGELNSDSVQYATYMQPSTTGSTGILGHGMTIDIDSGATVDRAQCGQFHIIVDAAATVNSRGGDPNAGLHCVHGKVLGESGSTWDSGHRVAPFWSDIQLNGVDESAEEVFHFFASAGGSRARALIRMEDQIADRFLESDGSVGEGFYATSGYEEPNGNTAAAWLVVNVGGTSYGVPMMAST